MSRFVSTSSPSSEEDVEDQDDCENYNAGVIRGIPCKKVRCDHEIIKCGDGGGDDNSNSRYDFYCSRECYQISKDLASKLSLMNNRSLTLEHVTVEGRGGTGLLADRESLDHLRIQWSEKFGRIVTVHNSGVQASKWKGKMTKSEKVKTRDDETKQRLRELLNFDLEDSEESEDSDEEAAEVCVLAQEEIESTFRSDVNAAICPVHPPLFNSVVDGRTKHLKAYTICVTSPWEVYLQTVEMIKKVNEINAILNSPEGCIDPRLQLQHWTPEPGGFCSAKFEKKLYRAKILKEEDGGDSFQVKFVDYGNVELVPKSEVHQLSPKVTLIPRQCIYSRIANVKPKNVEGNKWNEEVCEFTIEHLDGAAVDLEVEVVEREIIHAGKLHVLRSLSGQVLGDFGEALVQRGMAEPDSYLLS